MIGNCGEKELSLTSEIACAVERVGLLLRERDRGCLIERQSIGSFSFVDPRVLSDGWD